jgi:hypothetical protein
MRLNPLDKTYSQLGMRGPSCGHDPNAGRSPRSTSPAGAAHAPPHRPPTRASRPPKIAAMMITATIPDKQPKQAQARPQRGAQVGKLI